MVQQSQHLSIDHLVFHIEEKGTQRCSHNVDTQPQPSVTRCASGLNTAALLRHATTQEARNGDVAGRYWSFGYNITSEPPKSENCRNPDEPPKVGPCSEFRGC